MPAKYDAASIENFYSKSRPFFNTDTVASCPLLLHSPSRCGRDYKFKEVFLLLVSNIKIINQAKSYTLDL